MTTYGLITAAKDERAHVTHTIASVVKQTTKPLVWAIVSDGSTDGTDDIVRDAAQDHAFIQLLRTDHRKQRNFGSQSLAINFGWDEIRHNDLDFVGMLDADISLEPDYYDLMLKEFGRDERLGIAGGFLYEQKGREFRQLRTNSVNSVPGGVQLFRRQCWVDVGGYRPLPLGGMDTLAEVLARMHGWEVRAFPHLPVFHHKSISGRFPMILKRHFTSGRAEYSLGYHPLFEILKCARRLKESPYVVGSIARWAGFFFACLRQEKRVASAEMIRSLRREQVSRIRWML